MQEDTKAGAIDDGSARSYSLRQLEAEVGAMVIRKRDLELELKAVAQSLDALVKRYDSAKAGK